MYTRSYPKRTTRDNAPLPPDYGGTALVIKPPEPEPQPRSALTYPRAPFSGNDGKPRRMLYDYDDNVIYGNEDKFEAPFGSLGQNGEGQEKNTEIPSSSMTLDDKKPAPVIDLSKLKTDDLLLLGLAFLIFTDKDRDEGIPIDALLILAMLFLSGL